MTFLGLSLRRSSVSSIIVCVALLVLSGNATAQESPQQQPAPIERHAPAPGEQQPAATDAAPVWVYDKAIFQKPIPPDQLTFLKQFEGAPSSKLWKDKQFHKLVNNILPTGMFHYGRDRSIFDALDLVTYKSTIPVQVLSGRYLVVAGDVSPELRGRGFVWIDLQDGVALGCFSFYPTNGEPTPSMVIFSRQIVKENSIAMGQLPPEFATFLRGWTGKYQIPMITARYFITGSNKRILLEHDEDYCSAMDGLPAPNGGTCGQMIFEAADMDVTVADYLEATHHATNATAQMISGDQQVWLQTRASTCGVIVACRIRVTVERKNVILHRPPPAPHPGPPRR